MIPKTWLEELLKDSAILRQIELAAANTTSSDSFLTAVKSALKTNEQIHKK